MASVVEYKLDRLPEGQDYNGSFDLVRWRIVPISTEERRVVRELEMDLEGFEDEGQAEAQADKLQNWVRLRTK